MVESSSEDQDVDIGALSDATCKSKSDEHGNASKNRKEKTEDEMSPVKLTYLQAATREKP